MQKKSVRHIIFSSEFTLIAILSLIKLVLHFCFNGGYGYFRDELYYIACGEHLDFGYVDHPPFVALVVKLSRLLWGDSLFSIRLFPAVAGAFVVFLTGWIVREMGGKKFSQALACVAVIVSPLFLHTGNTLSMNVFDHLFWALSILIVIRILKNENTRLWLLLGVVLGLGLMNKHSVFFLGFGLFIGFVLTQARKHLSSLHLWIGALIAFLIFLPHLIWQFVHRFPSVEFIRNASQYKNMPLSPKMFVFGQLIETHPFLFLLVVLGVFYFILFKSAKPFRVFGWMYLAIFGLFLLTRAKTYYIAPAYPVMFAGGSLALEFIIRRWNLNWLKAATIAFFIGGSLLTVPFALPVLHVETFIKYSRLLGFSPPQSEDHEMGILPQHYADMFGWESLVSTVNDVYQSLPSEVRAKCGVFAQNYGEAGAVDFFGGKYGLPKAMSGHNNYWLWGPGPQSGEVMIVIGGEKTELEQFFGRVDLAGIFQNAYVMPYENDLPLFVCRDLKMPTGDLWPRLKHYE